MGLEKKFWKDKNILITGNTGFKGSWLSMWLNSLGANVFGLGLLPQKKNDLFNLLNLQKDNDCSFSDIRNKDECKNIIKSADPEIIIHLAAQSLVLSSYVDPVYTYETNVLGTINILEAYKYCKKLKLVLVVTSDKCYHNIEKNTGYVESDPMGGQDPYSSSKGCAELVSSAYRKSYYEKNMIGLATARAGNVIGGGDWADNRLIPDIMSSFFLEKKLLIRNPNSIRPWQHVLDPLNGYLLLCEKLWNNPNKFSGGWNFGPSEHNLVSVIDILKHTKSLIGEKSNWEMDDGNYPHESKTLLLKSEKAMKLLGWKPKYSWEKSLELSIAWYNDYFLKNNDIKELTYQQINSYINNE